MTRCTVTRGLERYELVVLLPNSEHTMGNNIMKYQLCNAGARTVRLRQKTFSIFNGEYEV